MADTKLTALTALTTLSTDDLLMLVDDVAGTPVGRKITGSNFLASLNLLGLFGGMSIQVFTSGSGVYVAPSGLKFAIAIVQGPGGNGGGSGSSTGDNACGGGGGGGCAIKVLTASNLSGFGAYTVGTTIGVVTSLEISGGVVIIGNFGSNGSASANSTTIGTAGDGGTGGDAAGGDINISGADGSAGVVFSTTLGQGGRGGDSFLGCGGRGGSDDENGAAGENYGGGGGGEHNSGSGNVRTGGSGAGGAIIMLEFK